MLSSGSSLAAAHRPRVRKEEQGVRARTRWPLTLARGARRTPCSATSDGRPTLGRPGHHAVRGIGDRLRRNPHPLVLERASRESPVPSPPSPGLELRGTGARLVWPPCRSRYRTATPGSCAGARPCR